MIVFPIEIRKIVKLIKPEKDFVFEYDVNSKECKIGNEECLITIKETLPLQHNISVDFIPLLKIIKSAKVSEVVLLNEIDDQIYTQIKGNKKTRTQLSKKSVKFSIYNDQNILYTEKGTNEWIEKVKEISKYTKDISLYPELNYVHFVDGYMKASNLTSLYEWKHNDWKLKHVMVKPIYLQNIELFKKLPFTVSLGSTEIRLEGEKISVCIQTVKTLEKFFEKEREPFNTPLNISFNDSYKELTKQTTTFVKENTNYSGKRYKIPLRFVKNHIYLGNEIIGSSSNNVVTQIALKDALLPIEKEYNWSFQNDKLIASIKENDTITNIYFA